MTIKHLLERKYLFLWLAGLWSIFILFICLVSFKNLPNVAISSGDKYIHFSLYFIFVILWFCNFKNKKTKNNNLLFIILFGAIFYGGLIEILQSLYTTSRKGDIFDFFANTFGAITAVTVIFLYKALFTKNV